MFLSHASPRPASHAHGSTLLRPGTTSSSRPAPTSTIDVDHDWVRHLPTRANSVSSRPSAVTSPIRSSSSTSAAPYAITESLIVCQSQPNSTATSFTVRPFRPTCSVTQRPARSVIATRGAATVGAVSVNEPRSHDSRRHAHRRLRHTSRVGRPKHGRSTSSTVARSLARTEPPQRRHCGRPRRVSTCTRNGPSATSSTASTFTSGKPTSSSHMRVGSSSTGALDLEA